MAFRIVLFVLVGLVGCGDDSSIADAGDTEDTQVEDSGGDVGGDDVETDTSAGTPCPAVEPSTRGACPREGLVCQYGSHTCPTTATCGTAGWEVAAPSCIGEPPGGCPASREAADGTECEMENALCLFDDDLACTCTSCPNPYPVCMVVDPPVWACEAPNADAECPPAQPLLGATCSPEGKECDYGCEPGRRRVCEGGIWVSSSQPGGCPMSTRRAKRDIEYLDDAEVDALARVALDTRLTTYEYIDPALDGRRRLGFIIEDQPTSYAVDPERSQVDLYGYTSMLVAAIQRQEREIQALRRELQALRE